MRNYEDGYFDGENAFFDDFSVYPAAPAASQFAVMPQQAAPQFAAMPAPGIPEMTPEFIRQLQQGAATVGNAAQSGQLSAMFAPGTLSPFDPLAEYAKTAPVLSLKGNTEYENLDFQALPDTNYRLTVGGNVVGTASTPQEVAALVQQANAISEQGGKAVDVRLQKEVGFSDRAGVPSTAFSDVYANQPNNNGALDVLLPAALAAMGGVALGPVLGGAGTAGKAGILGASKLAGAAGAGLGSAAGSFAGSMATGADIEEALIKAGISGLTAGTLKGLSPGGASGGVGPMPDVDLAGLNDIVFGGGAAALPSAALEPMLTATAGRLAGAALPSVFGGAASGLADAALGGSAPSEDPMLESVGVRAPQPTVPVAGGVANIIGGAESLGRMPETIEEEATVTGQRYDDPGLGASLAVPVGAPPTNMDYSVFPGEEPMLESSPDRLQRDDFSAPLYVPSMDALPIFEAPFTGTDLPPMVEEEMQTVTQQRPQEPVEAPGALQDTLAEILQRYEPAPVDSYPEQTVSQQRPQEPRGTLTAPITLPDGTLDFGEVLPEETSSARREDTIPPFTLDVPPFNPAVIPPVTVPPVEAPMETPAEEEQVVSARRPDVVPPLSAGIAVPPLIIPPFAPPPTVPSGGGTGKTIGKVLTGLSLLDALSGALGAGGGGGTPASAASRLNPIFSAKLPSRGSVVPSDLGPRDMSGVDWKRYGFGPEKSFFNYVPANEEERRAMIAPAQPDTQLARGGALAVKKGGGTSGAGSFAVKGPGTGRSDEIPALLSDGEYVIDAETVAMLGDGSSEAGAKRLDDFRVNVRKHKGRNLAKGKFSANAKAPERYLSGGRVK